MKDKVNGFFFFSPNTSPDSVASPRPSRPSRSNLVVSSEDDVADSPSRSNLVGIGLGDFDGIGVGDGEGLGDGEGDAAGLGLADGDGLGDGEGTG